MWSGTDTSCKLRGRDPGFYGGPKSGRQAQGADLLRILTVNMSLDPVTGGGTAERTFQLSRHMASLGNECTILTAETGMTSERRALLKGCRIVALPVLSKRFHIPRVRKSDLTDLVASADVIHLMNHWTLLNALVYREARRLNKPYVVCPVGAFFKYYLSLIKLGFGRQLLFHVYFFSILLLGTRRMDNIIAGLKRMIGHTPAIGSVYAGDDKEK